MVHSYNKWAVEIVCCRKVGKTMKPRTQKCHKLKIVKIYNQDTCQNCGPLKAFTWRENGWKKWDETISGTILCWAMWIRCRLTFATRRLPRTLWSFPPLQWFAHPWPESLHHGRSQVTNHKLASLLSGWKRMKETRSQSAKTWEMQKNQAPELPSPRNPQ